MTPPAAATPAAVGRQGRGVAATGPAEWLALAAAPTFAAMALLTSVPDGGAHPVGHGSPLDGMTLMYLLMAVFHSSPWVKLRPGRRGAARRS